MACEKFITKHHRVRLSGAGDLVLRLSQVGLELQAVVITRSARAATPRIVMRSSFNGNVRSGGGMQSWRAPSLLGQDA